ncbi:MAG: Na+:solute symporter [Flavobacteriales bacterium TMED96]|nr:MAG: Na+:solute symporter [Flavobacteriales bacterium TMED96]
MKLELIDWPIIVIFFLITLLIGLWSSKTAGKSTDEFFLSGRNMPWWLLGVSMVATTFSADTPNLVTDIVRTNGVAGNWVWWAFLLTGMLTVFVYARLWRKSGVLTDLEFYEIRYSGKEAAFLRGFRAIYLGFFFNIMIMATVCLAAIKIGGIILGLSPLNTLLIASTITVIYSILGGFKGVVYTDFFQFILAMSVTIWSASFFIGLPEIQSLTNLFSHPNVINKLDLIPDINDREVFITIFVLPLAVQWWSVWYPGAEPGGGGYIAQRMLSAKDENNAIWATLLFNFAHYAIRPWPWIIIALASLIIFPDLASISEAFPGIDENFLENDLAYPAMMTLLPKGVIGLMVASLVAAFMSTISSHLNWGSSYIVHDFYSRFINSNSTDSKKVFIGRLSTLILMFLSACFALVLNNALQAFQILLQIGAGTGLLFILRWFWYRINAYSEITAMIVSFILALYLQIIHTRLGFEAIPQDIQFLTSVLITTIAWVSVSFLTPPSNLNTLKDFYIKIQPGGRGCNKIKAEIDNKEIEKKVFWTIPRGITCMIISVFAIYGSLFSVGYFIYGKSTQAIILFVITILAFFSLWKYSKN